MFRAAAEEDVLPGAVHTALASESERERRAGSGCSRLHSKRRIFISNRVEGTSSSTGESTVNIVDLAEIAGRTYPARRRTQNLVGGTSPIQAKNFSIGYVSLEPHGGQVPWHNQEQEEVYLVLEGDGEMCLGAERRPIKAGQAVYIPPPRFSPTHQHVLHNHAHDLLLRSGR